MATLPPELHPQIAALLTAQESRPSDPGPADLAAARASYLQAALELGGARESVADVQSIVVGSGIPARAYTPKCLCDEPGVLVWLHGGGWVMGDLEGFDHVCRALANASCQVVVSVDYRLAPEHRFPAAADDASCAVAWALGHGAEQLGYDPTRVVVGGDSAGGNLAAVAAAEHGGQLRGLALVYPALDLTMGSDSYDAPSPGPMLSRDEMSACIQAYLEDGSREDPRASPLLAEPAAVPAAFVAVAGHDVLRDDGLRYAAALEQAGVEVETIEFSDMVHGFLRWGGVVDRTGELIRALGTFTRRANA